MIEFEFVLFNFFHVNFDNKLNQRYIYSINIIGLYCIYIKSIILSFNKNALENLNIMFFNISTILFLYIYIYIFTACILMI